MFNFLNREIAKAKKIIMKKKTIKNYVHSFRVWENFVKPN